MVILCVGYFSVAGTPDTEEVRDEKTEALTWMIRGASQYQFVLYFKITVI